MSKASFGTFREQLEGLLDEMGKNYGKIGDLLLRAKKELLGYDYDRLEEFLIGRDWTKADIAAAKGIAEGKLDHRLFWAGVKNSKILTLSDTDQKRLLSGEKFALKSPDGRGQYHQTWEVMSPAEKDQLLGPKGGRIRLPEEQIISGNVKQKNITVFENVSYTNKTLTLSYGYKSGEIQTGAIVQQLVESDQLDDFIADLNAIRAERMVASAT
jgi:hypothetical protein